MAVGTISNGDDYRINLIRRTSAAGAIVHEEGMELHFIIEGAELWLPAASLSGQQTGAEQILHRDWHEESLLAMRYLFLKARLTNI